MVSQWQSMELAFGFETLHAVSLCKSHSALKISLLKQLTDMLRLNSADQDKVIKGKSKHWSGNKI